MNFRQSTDIATSGFVAGTSAIAQLGRTHPSLSVDHRGGIPAARSHGRMAVADTGS
jgi:hypothetical protein